MLNLLFSDPFAFFLIIVGIILAIGLHEAAHCFMADYLGDPTPRSMGRLTLNPLAHLDPLGTLCIIITGFYGWGKPAPFDPYNLKDPKKDTALIALAGPVTNLLLAVLFAIVIRFLPVPFSIASILYHYLSLNVGLAIFNLLPVPPLDGSKVIGLFLSHEGSIRYQNFAGQNTHFLVLLLIMPIFSGTSLASLITSPIISAIINFLLPIT
jgi:Zn-dependent protease